MYKTESPKQKSAPANASLEALQMHIASCVQPALSLALVAPTLAHSLVLKHHSLVWKQDIG